MWATWFPAGGVPSSFVQGMPLSDFTLSEKGRTPFHFQVNDNEIGEDFCRGALEVDGHRISWNLQYRSSFRVTLSSKGWIGFSRTPHSDAMFSGEITFDDRKFTGNPLGFGVQGHNCGYRHRNFWRWTHVYFSQTGKEPSTFEALVYEMPFGLVFRKAVLWHKGKAHIFRNVRELRSSRDEMQWEFQSSSRDGLRIAVSIDGRGRSLHRLPYLKTDCSGTFEVSNNSFSSASIVIQHASGRSEKLETNTGAVLEMVG